ncbi:MAG: winged helix-turn-helix domain-containing protein [Anaerolineae bacterium]|nr:winged helix-turn-helix domain-containing protein [Anaerolineae bacterium]
MARRQLLKAINRSVILNAIKAYGPISRADIARLTDLSPAAVTSQTAELIEDGLVYEKQEGDSRGGAAAHPARAQRDGRLRGGRQAGGGAGHPGADRPQR